MGVIAFDIKARIPVAGGKPFGEWGPYEELAGTLTFSADPSAEVNAPIRGLDLVPTDPNGRVLFETDFVLSRPVSQGETPSRLLVDVANRGRPSATTWLNTSGGYPEPTSEDVGNGFLMRHGFTVARCGWQLDLPPEADLLHLRGRHSDLAYHEEADVVHVIEPNLPAQSLPLAHRDHRPYPVADPHDPDATMNVRAHTGAERVTIPRNLWRFARNQGGIILDPRHIWFSEGFKPGLVYEIRYTANCPTVVGLGLLAIRDMTSWLLHGTKVEGHPTPGSFGHALGHGESQAGRLLRQLMYEGLNEDEMGRIVFSGLLVVVPGARRGEFNTTFGQPSKTTSEDVGATYPFHDRAIEDRVTRSNEGLLDRLVEKGMVPKVITVNTATEYWGGDRDSGGQASLLHINPNTDKDVASPDTSRVYLISGAQHIPQEWPTGRLTHRGIECRQMITSLDHRPFSRALLLALDKWVAHGEEPPANRVPRIDDGSAVPISEALQQMTAIPDFVVPSHVPTLGRRDPSARAVDERKLATSSPDRYQHYVSRVDGDGNEIAGIRHPEVAVPLATYVGFNPRAIHAAGLVTLVPAAGAMYPFAPTRAERIARGDSRRSIEERYTDESMYIKLLLQAAETLVDENLLLVEDLDRIIEPARKKYQVLAQENSSGG